MYFLFFIFIFLFFNFAPYFFFLPILFLQILNASSTPDKEKDKKVKCILSSNTCVLFFITISNIIFKNL